MKSDSSVRAEASSDPLWRWYWFRFARRPLPITVHLDKRDRQYHWRGIYGLQVGPWFVGAIKGSEIGLRND
jgi:hypothetical protein